MKSDRNCLTTAMRKNKKYSARYMVGISISIGCCSSTCFYIKGTKGRKKIVDHLFVHVNMPNANTTQANDHQTRNISVVFVFLFVTFLFSLMGNNFVFPPFHL